MGNPFTQAAKTWKGQLGGMRLLRRRFQSHREGARIRVSSGRVDPKTDIWDARSKKIINDTLPAVWVMEWKEPRTLHGLAIKEIDAQTTAVDVWTGKGAPPTDLRADKGWQHMGNYTQKLRTFGAHSTASVSVIFFTPALAAAEWAKPGPPVQA